GRVIEALVMIVNSNRQDPLGLRLPDDVIVQNLADLPGSRDAVAGFYKRGFVLLADDIHAKFDAFIADENRRAGNELAHLMLAFAAKRAIERVFRVAAADLGHRTSPYHPKSCAHSGHAEAADVSRPRLADWHTNQPSLILAHT